MSLNKYSASLFDATGDLLKQYYQQPVHQPAATYRIADVKQSRTGQYTLVIQLLGLSTYIECTPQVILADDTLLEGFTKKDIRTITYFACEQTHQPKYRIIAQEFLDTLQRILFRIKECHANHTFTQTAAQLSLDPVLIRSLSHDDAHRIGYTAGYEHAMLELGVRRREE